MLVALEAIRPRCDHDGMRIRAAFLAVSLTALAITGCGGREGGSTRPSADRSATTAAPSEETGKPGAPEAVRVIRSWANAQRASDLEGASSYFALPSLVSNGGGPQRLTSRADTRRFNEALPCGAQLLRTSKTPRGRYTIATFRLVKRPGARCDGIGAQARTAFDIRHGKIQSWVRLADRPSDQSQPPNVPAPAPGPGDSAPGDGAQSI